MLGKAMTIDQGYDRSIDDQPGENWYGMPIWLAYVLT